jgi:hypothetical protein
MSQTGGRNRISGVRWKARWREMKERERQRAHNPLFGDILARSRIEDTSPVAFASSGKANVSGNGCSGN